MITQKTHFVKVVGTRFSSKSGAEKECAKPPKKELDICHNTA
jgi:hypothetical protein